MKTLFVCRENPTGTLRSRFTLLASATISVIFLMGCSTVQRTIVPFRTFVKEVLKYEPFQIARTDDGVGTIIDFRFGYENINEAPDTCWPETITKKAPSPVAIPTYSYSSENTAGGNASFNIPFNHLLGTNVQIEAALHDSRVKSVEIRFDSPFEIRVEEGSFKNAVKSLPSNPQCLQDMRNPKNLLIHSILGAKGIHYEFKTTNNFAMSIDVPLMKYLQFNTGDTNKYLGATSIAFTNTIYFGYRAYQVTEIPTAEGKDFAFREVEISELEQRKLLSHDPSKRSQ
jgi:hypothetical protein